MVAHPHITGDLLEHRIALEAALRPQEHIIWTGQPRPSRIIRRGWIPIIGGCFYLALVFCMLWYRVKDLPGGLDDPDLLKNILIFAPFLLAGGYLLTKPLRDISRATHVYYLITTQRALILSHAKTTTIKTFSPEQVRAARLRRESDGSGDIWFEKKGHHPQLHGFLGLDNVDGVADHLAAIK